MTRLPPSLRTQILLLVLGGAIIPLALAGLWLNRTAARAGEELLRNHLAESADRMARTVAERWQYRDSEVSLVSGNDVTMRAVAGRPLGLSDSTYLLELTRTLSDVFLAIELRNVVGTTVWQSVNALRSALAGRNSPLPMQQTSEPVHHVTRPVVGPDGARIGEAIVQIRMGALLPTDSSLLTVPGAQIAMRTMADSLMLTSTAPDRQFPNSGKTTVDTVPRITIYRDVPSAGITVAVSAPSERYLAPFDTAARNGAIALTSISILVIVLSILLANRATRALRTLVDASEAISAGAMGRKVDATGPAEIRRVGHAFNLMTDNLARTLDELSRRNALAAVGEFATSLSHDVRNALTSIKVDMERASRRNFDDATALRLVQRSLGNVERLEATVSGALSIARQGNTPFHAIDLRAVVSEAAETARGAFEVRAAELQVELPEAPVLLVGDKGALTQLFANLLFNACQSLDAGGKAFARVTKHDNTATVEITDTGGGIDAADLELLSKGASAVRVRGSGLGLPIARKIAAAHRGRIELESTPGSGTVVRVTLPLLNVSFNEFEQNVAGET